MGPIAKIIVSDIAPVVIALAALLASAYAIRVANRQATSDFLAAQQVKADGVQLAATMVSLVNKSLMNTANTLGAQAGGTTSPEPVDIEYERRATNDFLNSPSSMAYLALAIERSREADASGQKAEPWRTFHWNLTNVVTADSVGKAAESAVTVLVLLTDMDESDFEYVAESVRDLPRALDRLKLLLNQDPVLSAFVEAWKQRQASADR